MGEKMEKKMGERKTMRRIIGLILAVFMTGAFAVSFVVSDSGEACAAAATPFAQHGRLAVSGTKLVDEKGQNVQLRGCKYIQSCMVSSVLFKGFLSVIAGRLGGKCGPPCHVYL